MPQSIETLKAELKAIEECERILNGQHNISPQELEAHRLRLERKDEIIAELRKWSAMTPARQAE